VQVVRGKYDDTDDPGAINHFQALSAALSATVGLGNIAGVALAVALGGPGAIFWMWVIGLVGMALKMTEVTQSMLFRNTDDPDNPHGGPMFVAKGLVNDRGFFGGGAVLTYLSPTRHLDRPCRADRRRSSSSPGAAHLVRSPGGNMFQAWNVADVTSTYFEIPQVVSGIVLTVVVGR
jgi:AGCS family alanine or glycine:cation symporter